MPWPEGSWTCWRTATVGGAWARPAALAWRSGTRPPAWRAPRPTCTRRSSAADHCRWPGSVGTLERSPQTAGVREHVIPPGYLPRHTKTHDSSASPPSAEARCFVHGGRMPNAEKVEKVAALKERIKGSNGLLLAEYRGLS